MFVRSCTYLHLLVCKCLSFYAHIHLCVCEKEVCASPPPPPPPLCTVINNNLALISRPAALINNIHTFINLNYSQSMQLFIENPPNK